MARRCGLRKVQHLDEERRGKLQRRLGEVGGLDGWAAVCDRVERSGFLLGEVPGKDWKCRFKWVVEPDNLAALLEGDYDDPPSRAFMNGANDPEATITSMEARAGT